VWGTPQKKRAAARISEDVSPPARLCQPSNIASFQIECSAPFQAHIWGETTE